MSIAYLIGTAFLALVHVLGRAVDLERFPHRRRWLSVAAGVSVAYVFVDLLPLMNEKQAAFLGEVAGRGLPFPEFRVNLAALVGFTAFYGLEHFAGQGTEPSGASRRALHVTGFAIYNLMMGYLLIDWSRNAAGLALYCGALGLHFLVTDDGLRRDYGAFWDRAGRWVMAGCLVAGAGVASLTPLSLDVLTIVVGLVAGGVVINSVKDELPSAGGGRFLPFAAGAFAYAALIIAASRLGRAG